MLYCWWWANLVNIHTAAHTTGECAKEEEKLLYFHTQNSSLHLFNNIRSEKPTPSSETKKKAFCLLIRRWNVVSTEVRVVNSKDSDGSGAQQHTTTNALVCLVCVFVAAIFFFLVALCASVTLSDQAGLLVVVVVLSLVIGIKVIYWVVVIANEMQWVNASCCPKLCKFKLIK